MRMTSIQPMPEAPPEPSAVEAAPPAVHTHEGTHAAHSANGARGKDLTKLAIGALGVVYGDIGTSPLYAIRECVTPPHGVGVTPENILGILSLVFWSLTLVISVKYLRFVMRADNDGEGGVLALMALVVSPMHAAKHRWTKSLAFL